MAARLLYLTLTRLLSWLALLGRRRSALIAETFDASARGQGATPAIRPSPPVLARPGQARRCAVAARADALRWDLRTRAYALRRTTEGMSKPEIIRCLKR